MTTYDTRGLVDGARISPQILGHQGPRFVADYGHIPLEYDGNTGLWLCPLDRIFTDASRPILVFGVPNTALLIPRPDGLDWDRFAAYMFWRHESHLTGVRNRSQAGVYIELQDAPPEAVAALREAAQSMVGKRGASCAHSVARVLHRAGFTAGKLPLWRIFRPSQLASIVWRHGLKFRGQDINLRVIQTRQAVSDHFVNVWWREYNSLARLIAKYYAKSERTRVPRFEPIQETLELSDEHWTSDGPRVDIGIARPSPVGVNLGFVLGEQPEFRTKLPWRITDERLRERLPAFPGKLDWVTRLKKWVLFSPLVVWIMRRILCMQVEWIRDVSVLAIPAMLRRSPSASRNAAFVYNFVLTPRQLRIKRLLNNNGRDNKVVAWLLAKHVLLSGYRRDVILAGELWCTEVDGELRVYLSDNSGTYQPLPPRLIAAAEELSVMFQTPVVVVPR